MLWLTGGALVFCVLMILAFIVWVGGQGLSTFWPKAVERVVTVDGRVLMGEVARDERFTLSGDRVDELEGPAADRLRAEIAAGDGTIRRQLLRTGNFDLTGSHFHWVSDFEVAERSLPEWAVVVERLEWGRFYGFPQSYVWLTPLPEANEGDSATPRERLDALIATIRPDEGVAVRAVVERMEDGERRERVVEPADMLAGDRILAAAECWDGAATAWQKFEQQHEVARSLWHRRRALEKGEAGAIHKRLDDLRVELRAAQLDTNPPAPWVAAYQRLDEARTEGDAALITECEERLQRVERELGAPPAEFLAAIERVEAARAAADAELVGVSAQIEELDAEMERHGMWFHTAQPGNEKLLRLFEVVRAYPANQIGLGGELGVYGSRWGEFVADEPRESNFEGGVFPAIFGTVLMTLIMCIVVVPFGVLAALYLREYAKAGPIISLVRIAVNNLAGVPSIVFGVFGLGFFCYIVGSSLDELLFAPRLPEPTFGTGGLMWASLTLALLTLPVVIVATEEALAAVPKSMREGSYACGASKWQTIRRIVLPRAMPGIMTGAILAMARGAGEVAPLMMVGAAKLAPKLPLDFSDLPTLGVDRSFMHLGYHIYDLGFQSQNSEAAKPMVYTTTLLLIGIIATLNFAAIWLRKRLHRKFVANHF